MKADSYSGGPRTADSDAPYLLDRPLRTEPLRPNGDAGDGWGRAAAYDAYADGLHTYAIWLLNDHDAASDALYCTFVIADRNVRQLRQPDHIQPWLYALLRHECHLRRNSTRSTGSVPAPAPVSLRLRPPAGAADPTGSLAALERNLRRAEFHSLEWPESEGLDPAHREILELTIRHGLDSHGLGLVIGLGRDERAAREPQAADGGGFDSGGFDTGGFDTGGFSALADAWRELERSLAAVAVAKASREHCAQLTALTAGWSGRLTARLRGPLTEHVDGCTRCQHYLHTVIGTPAAPTILPFIAAPRSLRELVLAELRDPDSARRLGADHDVIAARIRYFTPQGFPADRRSSQPSFMHRRLRRQTASEASEPRIHARNLPPVFDAWWPAVEATDSVLVDDMYCAPGSWAARVLQPDLGYAPRRSSDAGNRSPVQGTVRRYEPLVVEMTSSDDDSTTGPFTAVRDEKSERTASIVTSGRVTSRAARHKARPIRQAVLSALALGAVGTAAAAAGVLFGATTDGHSVPLLDSAPSQDPATSLGGGLTVSVTSPPLPVASSHTRPPNARRAGAAAPGAAAAVGSSASGAGEVDGASAGADAGAADFHVSVNQRAADPNNVTIVLRNSGSAPVAWTAVVQDTWITLSQSAGTLGGGETAAIIATATASAPPGLWTSRVTFAPDGAAVVLHGGAAIPSSAPTSAPATGSSPGATPTGSPSAVATPPATPVASASAHSAKPMAARPTHVGRLSGAAGSGMPARAAV